MTKRLQISEADVINQTPAYKRWKEGDERYDQLINVLADRKITVRPSGGHFVPLKPGIEVQLDAKDWYRASEDQQKAMIKEALVTQVEHGEEISDYNDWDDALDIDYYEEVEAGE